MRTASLLAATLAVTSLGAAQASAASTDFKAVVDPIANPAVATGGKCPGLAIGIDQAGTLSELFYGKSGTARPLDGKTEFEIDSVTKTFTGLILALATQRSEKPVHLDDPLQMYAPPGVTLPTFGGVPIHLVDLATHTAGVPRGKIGDSGQTPQEVWGLTARLKLASQPGAKYLYSNIGFGLLGLAEERDQGQSLEKIFEQQITGPLGMPDTRMILSSEQLARKAQGHHPNGTKAANDDPAAKLGIAGAFALNSTLDDMMKYLALQLGSGPAPLTQAAALAQTPVHPIGPNGQVGLAWNVNHLHDGTLVINKDGTGPGFTDFVAFTPSTHTGVVVMANQLQCGVSKISFSILSALNHWSPDAGSLPDNSADSEP